MVTIKRFIDSDIEKLNFVLSTGKPSSTIKTKLNGFAPQKRVENVIDNDWVNILEFKVSAVREFLEWASEFENILHISMGSLDEKLKNKHGGTLISKFFPKDEQVKLARPIYEISVKQARLLALRVREVMELNLVPQKGSGELLSFFNGPVFEGISLSLNDYVELGIPNKPVFASACEYRVLVSH